MQKTLGEMTEDERDVPKGVQTLADSALELLIVSLSGCEPAGTEATHASGK